MKQRNYNSLKMIIKNSEKVGVGIRVRKGLAWLETFAGASNKG